MTRKTLIILFLSMLSIIAHSQNCDDVGMLVTKTNANDCDRNGSITITLSNIPTGLNITSYTAVAGGQTHTGTISNPSTISGLKSGSYEVRISGTCNSASFTKVYSSNVEITTAWTALEMNVLTALTKKSMTCLPTGSFTFNFRGGSAPYAIEIISHPTEYTGALNISVPNSGNFVLNNSPAGNYSFKLKDNCGSESLTGIVSIQNMVTDYNPMLDIGAFDGFNDKIYIRVSSTNSETRSYWTEGYYDIAFSYDGGVTLYEDNITISNYSIQFQLRDGKTYKEVYTNPVAIYLRVKGGSCGWSKVFSKVLKPPTPSIVPTISDCDLGVNIVVHKNAPTGGISGDGYGLSFPYKWTVFDNTNNLIESKSNLLGGDKIYMGPLPIGNYKSVVESSDGHIITNNFKIEEPKLTSTATDPICSLEGLKTNMQIYRNPSSDFPIGTKFTFVEGGYVGLIAPFTTTRKTNRIYPLSTDPHVLGSGLAIPGKHKIKVEICNSVEIIEITIKEPELKIESSVSLSPCNLNKVDFRIYNRSANFELGSYIEYVDGPQVPPNVRIEVSGQSWYSPFLLNPKNYDAVEIAKGEYTFKVYDAACNKEVLLKKIVGEAYSVSNFSYTLDTICSGINIKPKGVVITPPGESVATAYFGIVGYKTLNGANDPTWTDWTDRSVVKADQPLSIVKSGVYTLAIMGSNDYRCKVQTIDVRIENVFHSLDKRLSAYYVCKGSTGPGYIKFVAQGGMGTVFEYTLMDGSTVVGTNETGIFNYGLLGKEYTVKIKDKSTCGNTITEEFRLIDLTTTIIASTPKDKMCAGETIKLDCITLATTEIIEYKWTGPNGFSQVGQFLTIPNATSAMSGTYTVHAKPQDCGGEEISGSVNILVNSLPNMPNVPKPTVDVCFNSVVTLEGLTGATVSAGESLVWYDENNNVITNIATNIAKVLNIKVTSKNNISGCESAPVTVTITVLENVGYAKVTPVKAECSGTPLILEIKETKTNLKYNIEFNSVVIATAQGNGGTLQIPAGNYPTTDDIYYVYVENSGGCKGLNSSINIVVKEQILDANINAPDVSMCDGIPKLTATITGIVLTNPIIKWYATATSTTPLHTDNASTSTFIPTGSIDGEVLYYVSVEADGICGNAIRKEVKLSYSGKMAMTLATSGLMWEDDKGEITVTATGGVNPYAYSKDGTTWETSNKFQNLNVGRYTIQVKDDNGCVISKDIMVYGLAKPSIILKDSCSFQPSLNINIKYNRTTSYLWEYSIDKTTWNTISTTATCKDIKEGYYRVTITIDTISTIIGEIKLNVETFSTRDKVWYKAEIKP